MMIWVGIVLLLFVALIVCFLFARLRIIIEYKNGKPKIVFKSLFLKYTLDEKRLGKISDGSVSKMSKKDSKEDEKEELTAEGFLEKIERYREKYHEIKEIVVAVFSYLGPKVVFADISVKSKFGTGDAAKTGIICGAIWALTGNIYAFLCRFFNIEFPNMELEPMFDTKYFEIEARGIIKIRPVHIITAAIRGFKVYDKHKNKNDKGAD